MERDHVLKELFLRCELLCNKLQDMKISEGLCWLQSTPKGFLVQHVPTDVSRSIQHMLAANNSSWLFTSATLSVAGDASQFLTTLGLTQAQFHRFDAPFNYLQKARLYTPKIIVDPDHENYAAHLLVTVLPLLKMQLGRVLFLFTSHRSLKIMAGLLRQNGVKQLLVQGEADNNRLVEAFKQFSESVLLGTGSFWEGLDLSTSPISVVIIDKLPFASPAEPLVQLKSSELSGHGVDSFEHYLLPDAVIRLRQGCGRLLRRIEDSGVIMLADPRLHSRLYGQVFIDSLPAMERVNELSSLSPFLQSMKDSKKDVAM
jgi:ATP-dependent DNA helicase DinG